MAFTSLNSFLLTTDGRLFSWGAVSYCLGRQFNKDTPKEKGEIAGGIPLFQKQKSERVYHKQSVDIGEIEFDIAITKLATGRSHVLALDTSGRVWSWGLNDKGQLG